MKNSETSLRRRPVEWWERRKLEANGCYADDWTSIRICDATDLDAVRRVRFSGAVSLGILRAESGSVIENALLDNCTVGDYVCIRNIGVHLKNCRIGAGSRILDTGLIEFEEEAPCGYGVQVDVLDETGSRMVRIYPGLSSQTAVLAARMAAWRARHFDSLVDDWLESHKSPASIGRNAVIVGCGSLLNVAVGDEVKVEGALRLSNGSIVNNAAPGRCLAYVGEGVRAENFIIEDGIVGSGASLKNCFVGQGVEIGSGFSAHDSLFFANSTLENGEACALLSGPYTVSMHKSTLLIGCQTSFMNAGSGSNQSNHMYKMGPVHWGVLQRGVKTSSDSYLMLGAKIGAFSLLMGQHKTHPDSSQFPFSYLFGDEKGATVVVPAVMLRSCGLLRDEKKWPARDRRLKRKLPLHDRIIFDVLNPVTVDEMVSAYDVIEKLLGRPADDDRYVRYRGMKFTRASLERARYLYALGICKYLHERLASATFPESEREAAPDEWVDLGGLPIRRKDMEQVLRLESLSQMDEALDTAFKRYREYELEWIGARFQGQWRLAPEILAHRAEEFDRMVDEDRTRYLEELAAQNEMLQL